jgi:hypothetical protein
MTCWPVSKALKPESKRPPVRARSRLIDAAVRNIYAELTQVPLFAHFLELACVLQCNNRHNEVALKRDPTMDPKLTILFMLIGAVIVLSHLTEENLGRMRRQFADRQWREFVPSRRKA